MNTCILSGRLVRNAVSSGANDKALAFTLVTPYGYNAAENKERVAFVPCVYFNAPKELVTLFTDKGKGILIECEGRVANSPGNCADDVYGHSGSHRDRYISVADRYGSERSNSVADRRVTRYG